MYQGYGSIGISKQRVRHLSFYFIVRFFHIVSLSLCQLSYAFQKYPELNPNLFSIYQVLLHITHLWDLQKTNRCQHHIPQNHIRLTKVLWTYINNLTVTLLLTLLTPQHPHTPIIGTTEEGQLHRQLIILVLILIISGLWNIHGKQ